MKYQYRVDTLIPKSEFMSVTYMADGHPDFRKNFNPISFSSENLSRIVTEYAPFVVEFWERQIGHPDAVAFEGGEGFAEAPVTQEIDFSYAPPIEPQPEYDQFTQRITLDEIENPMQESVPWTVEELTTEEQADFLEEWRASAAAGMSQFRIAAEERGYKIDDIATASAADTQTRILWNTAAFVRRSSPFAKQVLGLDEEGLDEFFQHALKKEFVL